MLNALIVAMITYDSHVRTLKDPPSRIIPSPMEGCEQRGRHLPRFRETRIRDDLATRCHLFRDRGNLEESRAYLLDDVSISSTLLMLALC